MKIAVLDAATLGEDLDLSPLSSFGEVCIYSSTASDEIASHIQGAEVLVVNKFRCNADTLAGAEQLRLICVAATGYDNIDLDYCRTKGIAVCNVVGYSTDSVAQLTLAMALSLCTNLSSFDAYTKSGAYSRGGVANCLTPVYREIAGKTWGILGGGNIGSKVAAVAEAMGCRVLVCRRQAQGKYPCVSLETLCRQSDILSVHVPLTEQTRNMLDTAHLALMKPTAVLINVARGAVTDENAVAEAILNHRLGGFGCDVYAAEPLSAQHPFTRLYDSDRVILTPHMAWGAKEARERCLAVICQNIRAFLAGEKQNRVD